MGNSLVYLAISIILFAITFSLLFQIAPIILGSVQSAIAVVILNVNIEADWLLVHQDIDSQAQLILPVVMSLGVVIFILKVLMAATSKGAD